MRRPTLAHRLEYGLFAAAAAAVRRLPGPFALSAGARLARLGWRPLRVRRNVVEANIRTAFPDRDAAWIAETAAACYAHFGREVVALLRAARHGPASAWANTEIENGELVRAAIAQGRGVVVLTAHLGNWELGAAALATLDVPVDIVVQRQRNPLFDQALAAARRALGVAVMDRGVVTREGVRSLRANRVLVVAPDQNAGRNGVFIPFFGRPASTTRSPAILAARAASPVLMTTAVRGQDGRLQVSLTPLAERVAPRSDADVMGLLARYVGALETAIRRTPEQYFWHHRRWKTRPAPTVA